MSRGKDGGEEEMPADKPRICFVISWSGEDGSEVRRHADKVLDHVIRPVVESEDFGFKVVRADEMARSGMIDTDVIHHVATAPLVVADLTGRHPNV